MRPQTLYELEGDVAAARRVLNAKVAAHEAAKAEAKTARMARVKAMRAMRAAVGARPFIQREAKARRADFVVAALAESATLNASRAAGDAAASAKAALDRAEAALAARKAQR